jgi:hypothetical protein
MCYNREETNTKQNVSLWELYGVIGPLFDVGLRSSEGLSQCVENDKRAICEIGKGAGTG